MCRGRSRLTHNVVAPCRLKTDHSHPDIPLLTTSARGTHYAVRNTAVFDAATLKIERKFKGEWQKKKQANLAITGNSFQYSFVLAMFSHCGRIFFPHVSFHVILVEYAQFILILFCQCNYTFIE